MDRRLASGAAKGTVPQESWSSWPGATCTARPKSTMVTRLLASIIMFLNLGAKPGEPGEPGEKTGEKPGEKPGVFIISKE